MQRLLRRHVEHYSQLVFTRVIDGSCMCQPSSSARVVARARPLSRREPAIRFPKKMTKG